MSMRKKKNKMKREIETERENQTSTIQHCCKYGTSLRSSRKTFSSSRFPFFSFRFFFIFMFSFVLSLPVYICCIEINKKNRNLLKLKYTVNPIFTSLHQFIKDN